MAKYYRVVKDHPLWETGAIIKADEDGDSYKPIDTVWVKELKSDENYDNYSEGGKLVENQPEWFERVYPISDLKKKLFGTKKQAQAAAAALYKEGK